MCLAVLSCQSLGADQTSVVDEFNDALEEGLQSVRVLIQNTESHLPSAVNKAFDCEYRTPTVVFITLALNFIIRVFCINNQLMYHSQQLK